jgi:hypothetical protein
MAFLQSLHALFMSSAICCLKKSASSEQCVTSGRPYAIRLALFPLPTQASSAKGILCCSIQFAKP